MSFYELVKESKNQGFEKYFDLPTSKLDNFKLLTGKHQGRTFKELLEQEPKYSFWVMSNSKNPKNNMGLFKHYLSEKLNENITLTSTEIDN